MPTGKEIGSLHYCLISPSGSCGDAGMENDFHIAHVHRRENHEDICRHFQRNLTGFDE